MEQAAMGVWSPPPTAATKHVGQPAFRGHHLFAEFAFARYTDWKG